jgi:NDP-sugar pyrophosphorylase family protein
MRDQLGVREIVVIVGHLGDQIRARLGDGERLGVKLHYVECQDPTLDEATVYSPVAELVSQRDRQE